MKRKQSAPYNVKSVINSRWLRLLIEGLDGAHPSYSCDTYAVTHFAVVPSHDAEEPLRCGSIRHAIVQEDSQVHFDQIRIYSLPPELCAEVTEAAQGCIKKGSCCSCRPASG